eukprot:EC722591.1.p3 GENE.EC722591.1~~EC722591.1.p3  ORF type:complete len:75 (-),score=6.33 EC722591.1:223-447(-)
MTRLGFERFAACFTIEQFIIKCGVLTSFKILNSSSEANGKKKERVHIVSQDVSSAMSSDVSRDRARNRRKAMLA